MRASDHRIQNDFFPQDLHFSDISICCGFIRLKRRMSKEKKRERDSVISHVTAIKTSSCDSLLSQRAATCTESVCVCPLKQSIV